MKKNYITPALITVTLAQKHIIAASFVSPLGNRSTQNVNGSAALVKENNYNVWDEDWSK